ncbi:DNA helicase/exodeoxyribonuclease V, subunit A [Lachnospiraceae bacterium]|nr:DNA helicase/exodeoxyribonuclease V, subunit A [Lachnospiraceae bacterium]
MNFTEDQTKVIEHRGKNILVAAAAGSGKTAVLVERIIQRLLDPEKPVDIDRLLVVTFTNAAAAEMRERIGKRLEKAQEEDPDNEQIEKQLNLLHASHIMTIDSFCRQVIRDNFDRIDLDPSFRIGDETEMALLRDDAVNETLDEAYEEKRQEFLDFLEQCSVKKDDQDIRKAVLDLFNAAGSRVDPEGWLQALADPYIEAETKPIEEQRWSGAAADLAHIVCGEVLDMMKRAEAICEEADGPYIYLDNVHQDMDAVEAVMAAKDYSSIRGAVQNLSYGRLSSKKDENINPDLREQVKNMRKTWKDRMTGLGEKLFSRSAEDAVDELISCRQNVQELSRLTLAFSAKFMEKKQRSNILDFSDLEHYALKILMTPASDAYREYFEEIMTDEYQDSNNVQEAILTSIARENNYFCVGDVKQSIYSFRLAEPGIFIDRSERCKTDEKSEEIVLSKNFRSRKSVLDSVNTVFRDIMHSNVGNVEYDKDAELYYGASYSDDTREHTSELMLIRYDTNDDIGRQELEARETAVRIKKLVGEFDVQNRDTKEVRKAGYGDIVILLRSMSGGLDEIYRKALTDAGIPVSLESRSGYFQTEEIRTIISYITIIDNPRQDIPLAAVMGSVIGGFSPAEMAEIRLCSPEGSFYDCVCAAAGEIEDEDGQKASAELSEKAQRFLKDLRYYRAQVPHTPIHELLRMMIRDTGFGLYAAAKGGMASANLELLISRAADYEKTSYRGLFRFVRYIEKIRKNDIEMGEASEQDQENAVRIMTIHKSKGLEFPIVFIGNLTHEFNFSDSRNDIITDKDLGIGMNFTDPSLRLKHSSVLKDTIAVRKKISAIGEELRVFYVAMTRAQEKLIMTAAVKDTEKWLGEAGKGMSGTSSYLDFLQCAKDSFLEDGTIVINEISLESAVEEEVTEQTERLERMALYKTLDTAEIFDDEIHKKMLRSAGWKYAHEDTFAVPVKVSVSQLKKRAMEEGEIPAKELFPEVDDEAEKSEADLEQERERMAAAAELGTAYHKAFELFPLSEKPDEDGVKKYLNRLMKEKRFSVESRRKMREIDFVEFGRSELAERMRIADEEQKLFREQPFLIGRPASELDPDFPSDEMIQIQGIIDAFFEEEKGLVLVDYKTDRVSDEEILIDRYREQLRLYAEALEQLTGKKVVEKLIYSVSLRRVISL